FAAPVSAVVIGQRQKNGPIRDGLIKVLFHIPVHCLVVSFNIMFCALLARSLRKDKTQNGNDTDSEEKKSIQDWN
ncbi:hypothetical protein LDENG_00002550, partial [Lucifuga dentata]